MIPIQPDGTPEISGFPLDIALARLREAGYTPEVVFTAAPRRPITEGQARALRFSPEDGVLLAAFFPFPLSFPPRDPQGDLCDFSENEPPLP